MWNNNSKTSYIYASIDCRKYSAQIQKLLVGPTALKNDREP